MLSTVKTIFKSNAVKVILMGGLSLIILFCILYGITHTGYEETNKELIESILKGNGVWTLLILIISSPVAFIIWHFRDVNARQQIENQRKDINLKEFQKIAEWVSGAHLVEDKIVEKTTKKDTSSGEEKSEENSKECSQPSEQTAIQTFSKRDGAVGLQIAAVYNLLPFYRGENGEHFKKPAFNLLRTAWLSMQYKDLANLDKLKENAKSPLGLALTQVLLNGDGKYLLEYKDQFKSLSLPAMDFTIADNIDLQNVDLSGANLSKANLIGANLNKANLIGSNLNEVRLIKANLTRANLSEVYLGKANLNKANLSDANLSGIDLSEVNLNGANLSRTNLSDVLLNLKRLFDTKEITGAIILSSQVENKEDAKVLKEKGMIILEQNNGVLMKKVEIKSKKDIGFYVGYNLYNFINPELTKQNNPDWEFEFITE